MKRNRLIFVLLFYCSIVLLLAGCAKKEIKNIDSKGKNIICFGDSITFGYGANSKEAYPAILSQMTDVPVVNAGIDGDNSSEGLKRIKTDVLNKEPLLVIIEFGGNDFLRKIPKEVTIDNIRKMVEKIQEKGAMVAIVDMSAGFFMREYRLGFYKLAKEKDALFIPNVFSGILTNSHFKSDFVHPNAAGYKMIAQRIYRKIIPCLNQNTLIKKVAK